jgi:hypothetical protein
VTDDSRCTHDLPERESAINDGMCPLCQAAALDHALDQIEAMQPILNAAIKITDRQFGYTSDFRDLEEAVRNYKAKENHHEPD